MSNYKFYMQKVNKDGSLIENTLKDLEVAFKGLKYSKCEGINELGKAKNIYTEKYASSDTLRVYVPTEIKREATKVKLTLYFIGENRQAVFDAFNEYISNGRIKYWDTARNKSFIFVLMDEIKPNTDTYKGSTPYIECTYTLQNLYGKTEQVVEG